MFVCYLVMYEFLNRLFDCNEYKDFSVLRARSNKKKTNNIFFFIRLVDFELLALLLDLSILFFTYYTYYNNNVLMADFGLGGQSHDQLKPVTCAGVNIIMNFYRPDCHSSNVISIVST